MWRGILLKDEDTISLVGILILKKNSTPHSIPTAYVNDKRHQSTITGKGHYPWVNALCASLKMTHVDKSSYNSAVLLKNLSPFMDSAINEFLPLQRSL